MDLLSEEDTQIISVGGAVEKHLKKFKFPRPIKKIIHYSPLAAGARAKYVSLQSTEFEQFRNTVNINDLRLTAHTAIDDSGVPPIFADKAKAQFDTLDLDRSPKEKDTYRKLLFAYKNQFRELGS